MAFIPYSRQQVSEDDIAAVVAVMRDHGLTATVSSIHINGWIGAHNKPSGARWAVQQTLGSLVMGLEAQRFERDQALGDIPPL